MRRRSGSFSESECETPLWSVSGANIHRSSESSRAISSSTFSPGAWMPSSLVKRMRMSARLLDSRDPAHVALQHGGDGDGAILVLPRLHDGDERPPDSRARAVERVDEARLLRVLR